jgi:hypothetical protein
MIAGTVPYQHAGMPASLIFARPPLWYMEAIASMYTILASIDSGPHVSSSAMEEDTPTYMHGEDERSGTAKADPQLLVAGPRPLEIARGVGSAAPTSPPHSRGCCGPAKRPRTGVAPL